MDQEIAQAVLDQVFNLFVIPEIRKRLRCGELFQVQDIYSAQVIFKPDKSTIVRLNEQVKGKLLMEFLNGKMPSIGEPVKITRDSTIQKFRLGEADVDSAHITMIFLQGAWWLAFDFQYNKFQAIGQLTKVREFLNVAEFASIHGQSSAFTANLFYAVEIMAKTELLLHPPFGMGKSHTSAQKEYNTWHRLGNAPAEYNDLFNRLCNLRGKAVYSDLDFHVDQKQRDTMLLEANSMLIRIESIIDF